MISIHIEAHPDRGDLKDQVDRSLAAIGFIRSASLRPLNEQLAASTSDLSADKNETATAPAKPGRKKATDKPAPAAPADPAPDVQEQDASDEAAESAKAVEAAAAEAKVEPGEVFDRNVMRNAGGDYARIYGMPAAQEDGPKIIGYPAFSKVPDGEIEKATLALRVAIDANPYGRQKVAA